MDEDNSEFVNEKGLSRVDSESTHGWYVRGYKNKKTYAKFFGDKKFGGRDESLAAAREHRDALAAELDSTPSERLRRIVVRDSRNNTGVLGVTRMKRKSASGISESFCVTWKPEPGVQQSTSFSIRKYGEEAAFKMAVELRKQKMIEIFGKKGALEINKRVQQAQQKVKK